MRKINTRNYRLATRATPREVNRRIVLNLIREHQPISRAELARRMNVRRAALTAIVRDLLAGGRRLRDGPRRVGARAAADAAFVCRRAGASRWPSTFGPGKTSIALADFSGAVLERRVFDTPREPADLAKTLVSARRSDSRGAHAADGETPVTCHGIGIVVPGMVDRRSGQILYAPRLGWRDVHLRDAVREHLDVPVSVESAPIACALARLWLMTGEPRAVNNFAYVSVSDGVGVGIVMSGEVLRGEHHTAGELGHVSLDPSGPLCACGKRGCWEAFACNSSTIARYARSGRRPEVDWRESARVRRRSKRSFGERRSASRPRSRRSRKPVVRSVAVSRRW